MEVLNYPIADLFMNLVRESTDEIKLCSPFIKESIINEIYDNINCNISLNVLTKFNIANFYKKVSDISALDKILFNNHQVFNHSALHAKFYVFDNSNAIITSANLTFSGLNRNYEYGILINDPNSISQISNDFDQLCKSDQSGNINQDNIVEIQKILKDIPNFERIDIPKYEISCENEDNIFNEDIEFIVDKLSGWKKTVFEKLNQIEGQIFELKDIYLFENEIQRIYPNNQNTKPKIRQTLQFLRDLGLIKFEGSGFYRKLWEN